MLVVELQGVLVLALEATIWPQRACAVASWHQSSAVEARCAIARSISRAASSQRPVAAYARPSAHSASCSTMVEAHGCCSRFRRTGAASSGCPRDLDLGHSQECVGVVGGDLQELVIGCERGGIVGPLGRAAGSHEERFGIQGVDGQRRLGPDVGLLDLACFTESGGVSRQQFHVGPGLVGQ